MASTSTVQKSFKYDVFLSFRGEDTRNKFVSHLYKALEQSGIQTYKDDVKIEKGETIDAQLIKSIEDSRFYIIVFSKDYAGSSWCLDELAKIMECRKASEQTAYPIFYDVEPTEIRKQSGAVGKAFQKLENKEAAGKWREALKESADLAGWEPKKTANGDESKLIQIIVDHIFRKKSSSKVSVDEKLVGMETRIEFVLSSLKLDADDVRMIGIWGIGGGGKTTLAKAVFDRISIQFDGKAFVENVRELSKSPLYGLKKLLEQILCSVLSNKDITVNSVHEGTNMMKTCLRGRKVLIVLDDVDGREQLEALVGEPDWFKLGSTVIITTRDKQVLLAHRVKFIDVNLLSPAEAICLLSKNAFNRDIPTEGYKELSGQVVKYADGLPLTIKVLGSMLSGQNEHQWKDVLERLKKIPLKETMGILKLSYDALEDDYKEVFLDVACLLKGWNKDHAVIALKSCGFFAEAALRVLEQKSLITISEDKWQSLGMHDHIEEMGKNIVRGPNPNEPNTHSRLWNNEEIEEILANDSGTRTTKCMVVDARGLNFEMLLKGLENMKELRFLHVYNPPTVSEDASNWNLDEVKNWNLPNALRFLSWSWYAYSSELVGLQMHRSNMVKHWKVREEKVFSMLKFLKLTRTKLRTLDLGLATNLEMLYVKDCCDLVKIELITPNLKELHLECCHSLEELHMPAESPKLRFLTLFVSLLKTLDLGIAPNLETLTIDSCNEIVELKIPAECPKLVNLELRDLIKLTTLHLGITPNLETLSLSNCTDMVELKIPGECPKLVNLELRDLKLSSLDLGITPNLETLSLHNCTYHIVELEIPPECSKLVKLNLSDLNLETRNLDNCTDMVELKILANCSKLVNLKLRDLKLTTFGLGITPNLETLSLHNCTDMVELHIPAECSKLVHLELSNLKLKTLHLKISPNLETLNLWDCTDMVDLRMPNECRKLVSL